MYLYDVGTYNIQNTFLSIKFEIYSQNVIQMLF